MILFNKLSLIFISVDCKEYVIKREVKRHLVGITHRYGKLQGQRHEGFASDYKRRSQL
jgi:hypothetical protein